MSGENLIQMLPEAIYCSIILLVEVKDIKNSVTIHSTQSHSQSHKTCFKQLQET